MKSSPGAGAATVPIDSAGRLDWTGLCSANRRALEKHEAMQLTIPILPVPEHTSLNEIQLQGSDFGRLSPCWSPAAVGLALGSGGCTPKTWQRAGGVTSLQPASLECVKKQNKRDTSMSCGGGGRKGVFWHPFLPPAAPPTPAQPPPKRPFGTEAAL